MKLLTLILVALVVATVLSRPPSRKHDKRALEKLSARATKLTHGAKRNHDVLDGKISKRYHQKRNLDQAQRSYQGRSRLGDAPPSKCAKRCTGVKDKFNFNVGKSYTYNLESSSKVQFVGSQRPESDVKQTGKVIISVIEPCEFTLKLENVQIEGHNDPSWNEELERRPLRFSFDDGLIGEICPSSEEPSWALNIKRAVLSTFQNALEGSQLNSETYETDVSGKCPTKFEVINNGAEKTIEKKKDLITCHNHHSNYTALRGVQYNVKSKIQNAPLIDSNQECRQKIDRQILREAVCTETHNFRPFRQAKDTGILSTVRQTLTFVSEAQTTVQAAVGHRQSLSFDHSEFDFEISAEGANLARNNLRELCEKSGNDVRPETPGLFTELVYNLRKLQFTELKQISTDVASNKICPQDKKFFFDAVPVCGTETCVKLTADLLKSGTLSQAEVISWVTALALVPKPTLEMVKEVSDLAERLEPKALLGISSLIHGYCRENPTCAETAEVSEFISKLVRQLGDKCTSVRDNTEKAVFLLKAIGNVGHSDSLPALIGCISEERNPEEIRLAAVQALRRMPCGDQKLPLIERFRDTAEDIEVRIMSFLTLMKCPSSELITEIKDILEQESVTQVGSFVYSYLKEKSRTSDPLQRGLYDMLRHQRLNEKFNRDPRKFSRFYEIGNFMESWNLGGHAEAGLIMEPEGYLPRHGFLNLTVNLFGTSFNLLEIGGRAQGLERLGDKLFGPNGYFSNPSGYYFSQNEASKHSNKRVQDIEALVSQKQSFSEHLAMSMYLRVFGDDLAYYNFKNENMVDEIRNMLDTEKLMAKMAKEQSVQLSKNILFLDSTLTIPTISGIPLRLAVNGTASVNVEYGGKMDLTQLMKDQSVDIQGTIKPSAAIEISSTLALHVRSTKTGVRMVGRMHTSTAAKGFLSFQQGEFKSGLELPDDKMEVIDIQTQLFHLEKNVQIEEPGAVREKMEHQSCSGESFSRVTGLKICNSYSMPSRSMQPSVPYFPLTGPLKAQITIEKTDPALSRYEMTMKFVSTPADQEFLFGLDTPGSSQDREIKAKIQYKPGQSLIAELKTPVKELKLDGSMTADRDIQQGRLALLVDNTEQYSVTAKLQKTQEHGGNTHSFEAEVDMPEREDIKVTGSIKTQPKRYEATFNMEGLYDEPVEGKLLWEQPETGYNKFNSEMMFKCPGIHLDVKANGKADMTGNMDYKYEIEYMRPRIDTTPHKILASQVQTYSKESGMQKIHSVSKFSSSWYPSVNSESTFLMTKGGDLFEITWNAKYGADEKTIDLTYLTKVTEGDKYTTDVTFAMPQFRLNERAKLTYQNRYPSEFLGKLSWPTFKEFEGELRLKNSNENLWRMEAEAKAKYTGRELRFLKKIEETSPQTYKSDIVLQWQTGKQIEVNSDIVMKSERGVYEYEVNTDAKMSDQPDTIKFGKSFKMSRDETKYIALARKGSSSLYDFKLDMIKESNAKTNFQAQIKSEYMNNMDYDVSGSIENQNTNTNVEALVKKDGKEWMKGEVMLPTYAGQAPEVRAKYHMFWDLDSSEQKELMGDYKLIRSGDSRTHELKAKVKAGLADYFWDAKVVKSEYYIMNSTLSKNNQPLIESHWGGKAQGINMMDPRDLAIDFKLRTYAPMTPQHLTGLLTHTHGPREFKTTGYIQCHQHNRRAAFNVDGNAATVQNHGTEYTGNALLKVNDKELIISEEWTMPQTSTIGISGKATYKLGWAADKEIILNHEYATGSNSFIKAGLKTPFAKLSEMKTEIKLENPTTTPKLSSEFNWNGDKKIFGEVSGDLTLKNALDLNLMLETSFETLEKLQGKVKYDFNRQWDVETWIKWNADCRLKFVHKRVTEGGKFSADIDLEAVVPQAINLIGEAKYQHDQSQNKYTLNSRLTSGPEEYALDADVNTATKTGELKLQTPYEALNMARIIVSEVGNGEFKIETERNDDATGTITALIKASEMRLEVDNVRYPFNIIYEGQYDNNRWHIKAELSLEPNTSTKRTYGLQLTDETKGQDLAESQIVLKHPKRQMQIKLFRDATEQPDYKVTVEIQPNMAANRNPTQLMYLSRRDGKTDVQELKITDPSIPEGIKLIYKSDNDASCITDLCRMGNEINLDYSGEADKMLVLKTMFIYAPISSSSYEKNIQAEFELSHPATNLYLKEYFRIADASIFEVGMEYKCKKSRTIKVYSAKVQYSENGSRMSAELITPEDQWTLKYSKLMEDTRQVMLLRNGKPAYEIVLTYNNEERVARMEILKSDTSEILFHSSAQLTSNDVAKVKVWHTEQGLKIDDGEFIVKLNKADLLSTKFFVRPGFSRELQYVAEKQMENLKSTDSSNNLQQLVKGYAMTAGSAGSSLGSDINAQLEPFRNYLSEEKRLLEADMGPAMSEITAKIQVYLEMAKELLLAVVDVVEMSIDQLMETMPSDNIKDLYYSMKDTVGSIPENLAKMVEPITESYQKISEVFSDISRKVSQGMRTVSEKLDIEEAKRKIQQTWDDIQNSDFMQNMKSMYDSAVLSLTGLNPREVYDRYYSKVEEGYEQVSGQMDSMWAEWRDWLLEYQVGQYLAEWAQEIGSKLRSTVSYVDAEDKIDNAITWLRELISSYNPNSEEGWNRYMPQVKVNDPETGRYEMEIPLPMKADSLEHLARQLHPERLMSYKDSIERQLNSLMESEGSETEEITEPGYSVWDTVYQYKPASWTPIKWLPPYESTAFLIGGHHFVTFDGHVFDFVANCEYLLARDFHDKQFTISASFKQGNQYSGIAELDHLRIHTNGHLIELPRSGLVKIDGKTSELPWQKMDDMDGTILAQVKNMNHALVLKTQEGLKVHCTQEFFMCSFTLPGRYHGKSHGLLGSNDNEPNNDMMKPDRTRAQNVDEFASSWHLGGGECHAARNSAPTRRVEPNSEGHNACKRMFDNNNSPLRAGFSQVTPGPYMAMCTLDMQTFGQKAWCNISAAYIAATKRVGISLDLPSECASCSVPGSSTMNEGDSTRVEENRIPKTADIVFAVEERECMKWSQDKIPEIGRLLQGELQKKQVQAIRYGLVGFGGEGVHSSPHFHTGSGQIGFDLYGLQLATRQLAFDRKTMADLVSVDPMETMSFLTEQYSWRPATEKIVILLACTECGGKKVGYYELQNTLLEAGVKFHIITDKDVELEEEDEDEGNFIGLDAGKLFDAEGANQDLRGHLVEPHDSCTILAQETNGTVFSSSGDKQVLITRLTQEIGRKFQASSCQLCECQVEKLMSTTICYPCDIPRPVSLSGSDKFFNIPYLKLKKTYNSALKRIL